MRANGATAQEIAQSIHVSRGTVRRDYLLIADYYAARSIDHAVVKAIARRDLLVAPDATVTIAGV